MKRTLKIVNCEVNQFLIKMSKGEDRRQKLMDNSYEQLDYVEI